MAYTRGSNANIIVGAAALFASKTGALSSTSTLPAYVGNKSYKDTLQDGSAFTNLGYTMNGLELQFQPDFGEVAVDQVLDVAKLFKQGMQVNLNTTFAEATLENLLVAIAAKSTDLASANAAAGVHGGLKTLGMSAGDLGDVPVEAGLIAVGPGSGAAAATKAQEVERIYVAYRALSIENVSVSAKRDEASMFEVSFRLLPDDSASYGKIVDRTLGTAPAGGQ